MCYKICKGVSIWNKPDVYYIRKYTYNYCDKVSNMMKLSTPYKTREAAVAQAINFAKRKKNLYNESYHVESIGDYVCIKNTLTSAWYHKHGHMKTPLLAPPSSPCDACGVLDEAEPLD